MANIHSQKKRILRAERERLENRRYTSTIKTYFRRLEAAVSAADAETADTEHLRLVNTIDKAVKTGALHRNTRARKKSRAAPARAGHPPPYPSGCSRVPLSRPGSARAFCRWHRARQRPAGWRATKPAVARN